jgi:anti-sigma-K factor RskA
MKHERVTGDIQEMAALYALGSLSQHEARGFEAHLKEGCAVCDAELKRFEQAVGLLGLTASEADPPAYLRELLAAEAEHASKQAAPAPPAPPAPAPAAVKPAPVPKPAVAEAPAPPRPSAAWRTYVPWAVAVICAVVASYYYLAWQWANEGVRVKADEIAAAQGDAEQLRRMLEFERGRAQQLDHIDAVLGKPGTRVIMLAGVDPSSAASLAILWDLPGKRWVVTGHLPAAPTGKTYQLWYVTPTGRTSAGMLDPDAEGHVFKLLDLPDTAAGLTEAILTLEPSGGSAQPTWPMVARSAK